MQFGEAGRHYMAKTNAQIAGDYAEKIYDVIGPEDRFPDWVQYYVSIARTYLSDVEHALEVLVKDNRLRKNPDSSGDYMVYRNVFDVLNYSRKLDKLIDYDVEIPDWMEHKIAVARRYMGDVGHYIEWFLANQNEIKRNPRGSCWEGYERVPGTKQWSKGSCRKKKKKNPATKRRAKKGTYKLLKIGKSNQKGKKMMAVFENKKTGRKKTTHFGASGYSDFTKHKDEERKKRYISRHKKRENWNDPTTAGALSRWILWNKTTIKASIADFKRRFGL